MGSVRSLSNEADFSLYHLRSYVKFLCLRSYVKFFYLRSYVKFLWKNRYDVEPLGFVGNLTSLIDASRASGSRPSVYLRM